MVIGSDQGASGAKPDGESRAAQSVFSNAS